MKYIPFEEVFDKPYTYRTLLDTDDDREVEFRTRSGQVYVEFAVTGSTVQVQFHAGGGLKQETLRIFSTVVHAIKDFMEDRPDVIKLEFVSEIDDESRVRLYDRMANKYLSADYSLRISNYAGSRHYHATRKS